MTLQRLCSDGVRSSEMSSPFFDSIKSLQCVERFKAKERRGYIYLCNLTFWELKAEIKALLDIDLDKWRDLNSLSTREDVVAAVGDTKGESSKVDNGFDCNFLRSLIYEYDGKECYADCLPYLSVKVPDWRKFVIPQEVKIVIVENFSSVFNKEKYNSLWTEENDYLFVLRDENTKNVIEWLNENQPNNEVYHFGDFDMSGLQIYQNIKSKINEKGRYHLFKLPEDIFEEMIRRSDSKLFFKQYNYAHVDSSDEEVKDVIRLIKKYGKTIEQESIPELLSLVKN